MSEREKLTAIRDYIYNNFEYYQKGDDDLLNKSLDTTPYWLSKEISCYGASSIMGMFAQDYLGYKCLLLGTGKIGYGASDHRVTLVDLNKNGVFTRNGKDISEIEDIMEIEVGEFYDACPTKKANHKNFTYIDENW